MEDTKRIFTLVSRKQTDNHGIKRKNDQQESNNIQNTTRRIKDCETRTQTKPGIDYIYLERQKDPPSHLTFMYKLVKSLIW